MGDIFGVGISLSALWHVDAALKSSYRELYLYDTLATVQL